MPTATPDVVEPIRPQPGPQEQFLLATARWVFYGGAAGGGKSYAALLEPLYDIENPGFEAVIFRRYYKSIMGPGGLYQRSLEIYGRIAGTHFNKSELVWYFPSGAHVRFAYLQFDSDVTSWKSSEIALIEFDEVTEMSKYQVFYMLSRNRSVAGAIPRMRFFCNPDADSWAKEILAPWVDDTWPEDDRAEPGEVRYFIHRDDVISWVGPDHPNGISVTFIRADLEDNPLLQQKDPNYRRGLEALPELEKQRLLNGDWNVRPGGKMFKREWFPVVDGVPDDVERYCRFWDKAATAKTETGRGKKKGNDPDYTASVLMARRRKGVVPRYIVLDATWKQMDPADVETTIKNTASQDGRGVAVRWEQEGGASGKQDSFNFKVRVLEGHDADGIPSTGSKVLRARPLATQAQAGNVALLRRPWNVGFLNFLVAFPSELVHDDVVDSASGSFDWLYLEQPNRPLDDGDYDLPVPTAAQGVYVPPPPDEPGQRPDVRPLVDLRPLGTIADTEALAREQADPFAWAIAHGLIDE